MNVSIHYLHFCNVISHGPATDCVATIAMVMKLSGGTTDPNQIAVWWNQWQALKQAMKENHPMVKLAAALAPTDQPPVHPTVAGLGELLGSAPQFVVDENMPDGVIRMVGRDPNPN